MSEELETVCGVWRAPSRVRAEDKVSTDIESDFGAVNSAKISKLTRPKIWSLK